MKRRKVIICFEGEINPYVSRMGLIQPMKPSIVKEIEAYMGQKKLRLKQLNFVEESENEKKKERKRV